MLFRHKHAVSSALYGRGAESPRFWKTGYTIRSGIGSGSAWYVDNFPLEENGRGPGVYTNNNEAAERSPRAASTSSVEKIEVHHICPSARQHVEKELRSRSFAVGLRGELWADY